MLSLLRNADAEAASDREAAAMKLRDLKRFPFANLGAAAAAAEAAALRIGQGAMRPLPFPAAVNAVARKLGVKPWAGLVKRGGRGGGLYTLN
jgi:hypothetical protein